MKETIQEALKEVVQTLTTGDEVSFEVTLPKDDSHGDYMSSVALSLAGRLKRSPLDIAHALQEQLSKDDRLKCCAIEVAPPGYINISLTPEALSGVVAEIGGKKNNYRPIS